MAWGAGQTGRMSNDWDEYRDAFADRQETFNAYVDVWTRDLDGKRKFADWITFAKCADADLSMVRKAPDLVRQAELLLSRNGYRLGAGAGGSSRRWQHTKGAVRTTSERPVNDPAGKRGPRAAPSSRPKAPPRPKKPAPPPKAPPRPTHVECPHDPGMMVPLSGSCFCGWSPSGDD